MSELRADYKTGSLRSPTDYEQERINLEAREAELLAELADIQLLLDHHRRVHADRNARERCGIDWGNAPERSHLHQLLPDNGSAEPSSQFETGEATPM